MGHGGGNRGHRRGDNHDRGYGRGDNHDRGYGRGDDHDRGYGGGESRGLIGRVIRLLRGRRH